jgi:hypothetical protein
LRSNLLIVLDKSNSPKLATQETQSNSCKQISLLSNTAEIVENERQVTLVRYGCMNMNSSLIGGYGN